MPADRGRDSRSPRLPFRFSDLGSGCQALDCSILQARIFAQSSSPIFLWGPDSFLLLKMAAALHNEGSRSSQAFVELDMEELSFEEQKALLFGERGAVTMAEGGTLYLAGGTGHVSPKSRNLCSILPAATCAGMPRANASPQTCG